MTSHDTDAKHTGAAPYTRENVETVGDHVDSTYGKDMSKVDTDDSKTTGATAVEHGDVQSTSGKGGTTSQATNPTPKLAKDAADQDAPPAPAAPEAPVKKAPVAKALDGGFVVLTRQDGTRFAIASWDVQEISENVDGTVTVLLPGRDLVTGAGMTVPMPSGPQRIVVQGPFDEVVAAVHGAANAD